MLVFCFGSLECIFCFFLCGNALLIWHKLRNICLGAVYFCLLFFFFHLITLFLWQPGEGQPYGTNTTKRLCVHP